MDKNRGIQQSKNTFPGNLPLSGQALDNFPDLEADDIRACLKYASAQYLTVVPTVYLRMTSSR